VRFSARGFFFVVRAARISLLETTLTGLAERFGFFFFSRIFSVLSWAGFGPVLFGVGSCLGRFAVVSWSWC
jgi:hypothetical protein